MISFLLLTLGIFVLLSLIALGVSLGCLFQMFLVSWGRIVLLKTSLLELLLLYPIGFFKFYLFIYFWLCWVFVSVRGLSLVAASGGHSLSRWAGLSLSRSLLLQSTGSRRAGSVIVAHGPSRSAACGIFPDKGPNPCPLHWQADSQLLRHQGSPPIGFESSCFHCHLFPGIFLFHFWFLQWSLGYLVVYYLASKFLYFFVVSFL